MIVSSCQWERLHHQHWKEEMRSPPPHQPCRFQAQLENVLQHHACLGISSHLCNSLARQFKGHITNSVTIWHNLQVLTGMHHEGSTGTQTLYTYITQYLVHNAAMLLGPPTPFVGSCWSLLDLLVASHRSWQLFSFSPCEDLVLLTSSVANPWSSTSKRSESQKISKTSLHGDPERFGSAKGQITVLHLDCHCGRWILLWQWGYVFKAFHLRGNTSQPSFHPNAAWQPGIDTHHWWQKNNWAYGQYPIIN